MPRSQRGSLYRRMGITNIHAMNAILGAIYLGGSFAPAKS
jgi:hypothetical protein